MVVKCLNISQTVTRKAVLGRKHKKWAMFDTLMNITLSRHDNKTNNPIFSSTLWVLPVYFSFLSFISASQELQRSIPWDLLFCIMLWSVNYSFACQICWHRYPLSTWSLLTLVHNQMYTTCSVPNLINIWPQSHELY